MRKEPIVQKPTRFVGLDVHKDLIAVAVCEAGTEPSYLGTIPNEPEAVGRLMRKLGAPDTLQVCYEAGPCGYVLYEQLRGMDIDCLVVAPSLIPVRAGDRVKTDRKDALRLARCLRNGDLVQVFVPDGPHRALRELVRAREAALKDQRRARARLKLMLLRWGHKPDKKLSAWSPTYLAWLETVVREEPAEQLSYRDALAQVHHQSQRLRELEQALSQSVKQAPEPLQQVVQRLQCLRGVKELTAVTVAVEAGDLGRFDRAPELMSYAGLVPREYSSGGPAGQRRGRLTKTGNAHIRRVIVEAAWSYARPIRTRGPVHKRRQGQDPVAVQRAVAAERRLSRRYKHLVARGRPPQQAVVAVARELLGFVWSLSRVGAPPPPSRS
jgi:transposase